MKVFGLLSFVVVFHLTSAFSFASDKKSAQIPQTPSVDLSQPLTLENAIKIGLANQPTLGIAKTQVEASKARVVQAKSSYYPSIAPTFNYSNQLTSGTVNGQKFTGNVEQSVTQLGLRQLIFDSFKREENVLASRYSAKASEFNLLDTRQAIIVNITTAYYELRRRMELVKVAQASVDRAKTTLDFTTTSAEVGTGAKKDVLQAEADYQNAKVQLIVAQNDVRLGQTSLKNAMGVLNMVPVIMPDTPVAEPPAVPDTRTVADYLKTAYDRRPDLRRDTAGIDTNRHEVRIAQINAGPTVQADVTEGYRVDPDPGESRQFTTSLSYPLFDAGLTRAQVRQAKASLEQSRRQVDLTKQTIQLDVEQSYLSKEEARIRISATQAAQKAAQKNYEAATTSLREGAGTIIDVITAQTALVTADTNAVQALFDFYTNDARLKRAIGDNDPYLAQR